MIAHVANIVTMGAETSPVYAPNGSAWMFCTPTCDVGVRQRPGNRLKANHRRAYDTDDARDVGHGGYVVGQHRRVERRRVHLPVAGDDHRPPCAHVHLCAPSFSSVKSCSAALSISSNAL